MGVKFGTEEGTEGVGNYMGMGMGVGNYSLKSTLLPPVVLPKYSLNSRADRN